MKVSVLHITLIYIALLALGTICGYIFSQIADPHVYSASSPDSIRMPGDMVTVDTTPQPVKSVKIIAVGDIMLGRSVMGDMRKRGDFTWPFHRVADILRGSDITIANLETPIVADCPPSDSGFTFCADPKSIEGLRFAGIDLVSLANNHTTNYGKEGLLETQKILTESDIVTVGTGNVAVIEKQGIKFGFIGFNATGKLAGIDNSDEDTAKTLIDQAVKISNIQIAIYHWGAEYVREPNARQVEMAHRAVDLGVDLIIGAHPHWVQTNETYKDVPIYYSLGNFVFDQDWSEETKKGLAVEFEFTGAAISSVSEKPVYIDHYQPQWVEN